MSDQPNILLIMADDLGYSDIGCFGAEIRTPVLDELAAGGVRQTQFYNCARCCPTRASLMTGVHPHRAGVGHMVVDCGVPGYRGFIDPEVPTVAERLQTAGYQTWISGKWHCGGQYSGNKPEQWPQVGGDPKHPLPTQRGFERCYSMLAGACSYFDPITLYDQDRFVTIDELPEDYHLTDELGTRAAGFIDEAATENRPFFGYLAFTAPHWPLHAWERDIAPYRGSYTCGWDVIREQRLARMVADGLLPQDQALSERDEDAPAWEDAPDHTWEDERMAVYAAQVTAMDRAIGVAVEALRRNGLFENTLIVFCSDNGGCAEFLQEDPEPGVWASNFAYPTKQGGVIRVGNGHSWNPGPADTFMSYELPWSNASNTPFRKFKSWTHEGGISSPAVISWPQGLPAGTICHGVGHIVDLVATACALGGADTEGLAGVDLTPVWNGTVTEPIRTEPLCWEHQGNAAIRDGDWKLVRARAGKSWELYDIARDRVEEHDLAEQRPELVAELSQRWQAWADANGVLPWPVKQRAP